MKKIIFSLSFFLLPALASAATLSVSPSSQSVSAGDTFSVTVNLDTQGASIDGVDLRYLNYNPALLQAQSVTPGNLMPMTLANSINNNLGRITFSQVSAGGSKYKGSGVLATVTFRAVTTGAANLSFNYTNGNTTDSNVAAAGSDVLSAVVNGSYTIGSGSSSSSTGGTGSSGSSSGGGGGGGGGSGSSSGIGGGFGQGSGVGTTCVPGSQISLTRNLFRGLQGADVTSLQNFLISKGHLAVGNNTGLFGPLTEAAVQAFQRSQNIVSSGAPLSTGYGSVGPTTRARINALSSSCSAPNQNIQALLEQIKILQAQVNALLLKLQSMQGAR